MYDVISNKSIKFRFSITIIVIVVTMSIIFIYSNKMKDNIIKEYERYIDINLKLSDLSVEFNNRWLYFDSYYKYKDDEIRIKYYQTNNEIKKIIEYVLPYVNQDKDSSIYIRNLDTKNEWFQNNSYLVMVRDESTRSYDDYLDLRTMNSYISKHSSSLISSYLQFAEAKYSDVLDKYNMLDTNIYLLLTLTVVISMIIFKVVSDDIVKTLKNLSRYAKKLSNREWDTPDAIGDSYKELDEFTHALNHMKNSIKLYIEKINESARIESNYQSEKIKNIEKDKIIRETQLKLLQMQINPHFLFNNLNTVSRMAMFEGAANTVEIVDAVSKILRFNLSQRDSFIKLSDELEVVKAFAYIHNIKYEDRFSINYNIEEGLDDTKIPPMIVQLVVENSIKHGFVGMDKKGEININIYSREGFVVINVEDNGDGICKAKIQKIMGADDLEYSNNSTGLGISNIKKRLQLYFGRNDLLAIESSEGIGTKVRISIPT
ncbi:MAG: histidine kinase [Tissierella sp.]|nr:histidine kinase [Tissierella sp.]